ncbi:heavy metal translocating P-type ATPase metal-binding domain-containing protein [Limisphaera ngatamarikiensis]|nr:heavy metal translocating P-type ATPase metal-binding domain-containing protein [Limisphaera ngatamarikiensis]
MEPGPVAAGSDAGPAGSPSNCAHCGTPCGTGSVEVEGLRFCCAGCRTVFELLDRHGLSRFYELSRTPGLRVSGPVGAAQFAHLDDPEVLERVLDFSDGRRHRVTLHIPAIHCVACVWLLENLFRLHPGIGRCEVNYPRRDLMVEYAPERLRLSELVALLAWLGTSRCFTGGIWAGVGGLRRSRFGCGCNRVWRGLPLAM